jgi:hypothetical protein
MILNMISYVLLSKFTPPLLPLQAAPTNAAWLQLTLQQICSPACDPDFADPPNPLATGAGRAAVLQCGGSVMLALAVREGAREH